MIKEPQAVIKDERISSEEKNDVQKGTLCLSNTK